MKEKKCCVCVGVGGNKALFTCWVITVIISRMLWLAVSRFRMWSDPLNEEVSQQNRGTRIPVGRAVLLSLTWFQAEQQCPASLHKDSQLRLRIQMKLLGSVFQSLQHVLWVTWFPFSLLHWDDLLFCCQTCAASFCCLGQTLHVLTLKKKKNLPFFNYWWSCFFRLPAEKGLYCQRSTLFGFTCRHALQGCHTFQDIHISAVFMFPSTVSKEFIYNTRLSSGAVSASVSANSILLKHACPATI